jgi:hypothetical protein
MEITNGEPRQENKFSASAFICYLKQFAIAEVRQSFDGKDGKDQLDLTSR